jgi:hypothetical protein
MGNYINMMRDQAEAACNDLRAENEKLRKVLAFAEKKLTDVSIAYPSFYVLDALNMIDEALNKKG